MADQNVVVSGGSLAGQSLAAFHGPISAINPVAAWDLDGDLVAQYGTNMTLAEGTALYSPAANLGKECFAFDGATRASQAHVANLALVGAVTLAALVNVQKIHTGARAAVLDYAGGGEAQNLNTLWRMGLGVGNRLQWFHEYGLGSNELYDSDIVIPIGQWTHILCTRSASGKSINFYVNGILRDSHTFVNAPDGGSLAFASIGAHSGATEFFTGIISTPVVYNFALGSTQALELAQTTLPPELRT